LRTSIGPADLDEAVHAGCAAILMKPVLPEILLSEVQKRLRRSHALRKAATALRGRAAAVRKDADTVLHRSKDLVIRHRRRK
jgi:hypothetical protein